MWQSGFGREIIDSDISNIAVAVDLDVTSTNGIISVGA
jgi:hypothetical protein